MEHWRADTDCCCTLEILTHHWRAKITARDKWYSRWTFLERQIIELLQITSKIKFGLFDSFEHNSKMSRRGTDLINQDFNPSPCPLTHTHIQALMLIVISLLRDDLLECLCNEHCGPILKRTTAFRRLYVKHNYAIRDCSYVYYYYAGWYCASCVPQLSYHMIWITYQRWKR